MSTEGGEKSEKGAFRFSPRPNRASEVLWREWTDGAFAEAAAQGKLVLLSISAVWCHWCHVMDETTYSDDGIIERLNRDFIPVRVDSDMRPDINRRYNQGGWPTTAFLLPTGRPIAGLTYAPVDQLAALLDRLSALYRHRGEEILVEAAAQGAGEKEALEGLDPAAEIDEGAGAFVAERILSDWDRGYGGIGQDMKFPPFAALEFALQRYLETRDPSLKSFVVSTLDGMADGGLEDSVEGGFFRYSTTRDWSVPHYEKMLDDNARMIWLYLGASVALERPDYLEVARRAVDWALSTLLDDERRGFFGSQDADERYYHGDREARADMKSPPVDRTVYTDSTSAMISALAYASAVLEDPDLLEIARRSADHIWHEGFRHPLGVCHYFDGADSPALFGQPADQVSHLKALLDLYQATGDAALLERATELADVVLSEYAGGPGWLTERSGSETGGKGVLDDMPADVPDFAVNAEAARALLALEALVPLKGYGEAAGAVLRSLADGYKAYGHFASSFALAAELAARGPVEVRIDPEAPSGLRRELRAAALSAFNVRKLVRPETIEDFMPGEEEASSPPAVLCTPGTCRPVYSEEDIRSALMEAPALEVMERGKA